MNHCRKRRKGLERIGKYCCRERFLIQLQLVQDFPIDAAIASGLAEQQLNTDINAHSWMFLRWRDVGRVRHSSDHNLKTLR